MTIQVKTIVSFVASGGANTPVTVGVSGQNPLVSGDPIIEITDITAGAPATQFFGSVIVGTAANNLFILETVANAGIAGHICLALIGSK